MICRFCIRSPLPVCQLIDSKALVKIYECKVLLDSTTRPPPARTGQMGSERNRPPGRAKALIDEIGKSADVQSFKTINGRNGGTYAPNFVTVTPWRPTNP